MTFADWLRFLYAKPQLHFHDNKDVCVTRWPRAIPGFMKHQHSASNTAAKPAMAAKTTVLTPKTAASRAINNADT